MQYPLRSQHDSSKKTCDGKGILVADYNTKTLIPAEKAFWVIGGSKLGVMTKRAKWAFTEKGEALKFIKDNGGRLATFDEAIKATFAGYVPRYKNDS